MNNSTRIHWVRVLTGGFLAEAAVFMVVIPVLKFSGPRAVLFVVPVACLVMCFLFGVWVGRRIESRFVLHGFLVGVVATVLYLAVTRAQPEPFAFILAHALKLAGGAAGGLVAGRQRAV